MLSLFVPSYFIIFFYFSLLVLLNMKYVLLIFSVLFSSLVFAQNSKEIVFNKAKEINALSFEDVLELPGMGEESYLFSHETEIVAFIANEEIKKIQVTYKNKKKMDYFFENKICFFATVENEEGQFGKSYFFATDNQAVTDEFGYGFNVAAVPYLYLYAAEYQLADNKATKYSVEAELTEVPSDISACGNQTQSNVFQFQVVPSADNSELQGTIYVIVFCPNEADFVQGKRYKLQLASNDGGQRADIRNNQYSYIARTFYWCRSME